MVANLLLDLYNMSDPVIATAAPALGNTFFSLFGTHEDGDVPGGDVGVLPRWASIQKSREGYHYLTDSHRVLADRRIVLRSTAMYFALSRRTIGDDAFSRNRRMTLTCHSGGESLVTANLPMISATVNGVVVAAITPITD